MKILFFILCIYCLPSIGCNIKIKGRVEDEHDKSALSYAEIIYNKGQLLSVADSNGGFEISNICTGNIELIVKHIGCKPKIFNIIVNQDTTILLKLEHHIEVLNELQIIAFNENKKSLIVIDNSTLENNSKSLGELVHKIPSLSSQNSGPGIFKPAINGLFADRIAIVYNNIILRSQDWGTEHAPELDISNANSINILKDAKILQFASNAIGGIIVISDVKEYTLNTLNYKNKTSFSTNGLATLCSQQINYAKEIRKNKVLKLSMIGTYKINKDFETKNYNILNTASRLGNFSTVINFNQNIKHAFLKTVAYYSFYNNQLGIMRNAHIGNINDLLASINSDKPLYTEKNDFKIDNPKQMITHQVFSLQNNISLKDIKYFFFYTFQYDKRKEYDIRRNDRSNIPSLGMNLFTHQLQCNVEFMKRKLVYKFGADNLISINNNTENLGIKPIVPNYFKNSFALWSYLAVNINARNELQYSIRIQNDNLRVYKFDAGNNLISPKKTFFLFNAYSSYEYQSEVIDLNLTFSFNRRAPNIAELYSQGLHHGAATLEYGNENLKPENIINSNMVVSYKPSSFYKFCIMPYYYYIHNYIFLKPQANPVQTIRGAFFAYNYMPTNAQLYGIDIVQEIPILNKMIIFKSNFSINGNRENIFKDNLPNMPQTKLSNSIYISKDLDKKIKEINLSFVYDYYFKQKKINPNYEISPSPNGFGLLSSCLDIKLNYKNQEISLNLLAENILNITYNYYTDRFRFFSFGLGKNYTFTIIYNIKTNLKNNEKTLY